MKFAKVWREPEMFNDYVDEMSTKCRRNVDEMSTKCRRNVDEMSTKWWYFDEIWIGPEECRFDRSRSQKMLKNDYLVVKIGVDTAENEPKATLRGGVFTAVRGETPAPRLLAVKPEDARRLASRLPNTVKSWIVHPGWTKIFVNFLRILLKNS